MPSSYSTRLRFELIAPGEFGLSGNWGQTTNINLGTLIEEAIAGMATVTVNAATDTTLTTANGSTDQARNIFVDLTGVMTQANNIICPSVQKIYFVKNSTTGGFSVTFKTAAGTGITVLNGRTRALYCNGTNVVDLFNDLPSGALVGGSEIVSLSATQTLTNKTLTTPRVGTAILDANGNEAIRIASTPVAVNEIQVVNAATTGTPSILATGDDANVGINLIGKGSGQIFANGVAVVTLSATQTLTNKTLTSPTINTPTSVSPRITNGLFDVNANEMLSFVPTVAAVNEISISNAATLGSPAISAIGGDANISLNLVPKGTGTINIAGVPAVTTTGPQTLTNKTIDSGSTVSNATIANSTTINARDDIFQIQNNANSTKRARFEVSGVTAGQTRIITVPDQNYTLGSVLDDSVTTSKILNLNVTTAKIADLNVTTGKIADLNVTTAKIADLNVTTAKIADANVTDVKLASNSVTTAKITDLNVTEGKLADGSVTVNKIGAGAVTLAKLAQPFTSAGTVTLTGVSSREWTGIPSWVRRITISIQNLTCTNQAPAIRLGTSGGYLTTASYHFQSTDLGGWSISSPATSFSLKNPTGTAQMHGHWIFTSLDGLTWVTSLLLIVPNTGPYQVTGGGYVTLAAALDRVQFSNYINAGTNFTSGVAALHYE